MEERLLQSLKLRLKNMSDAEILDLLADVIAMVRDYIHRGVDEDIPGGCESVIKDLVMSKANRLGAEGITSESHSGVSQTYENTFSNDIKRRLNLYRRLP